MGSRLRLVSVAAVTGMLLALLSPSAPVSADALVRVNAGGPKVTGTPDWQPDWAGTPSVYVNADAAETKVRRHTDPVSLGASLPATTPTALFQSERYDTAGGTDMVWTFPVTPGQYDIRLYFAETYSGTQSVGARIFDVSVEGATRGPDHREDVLRRLHELGHALV